MWEVDCRHASIVATMRSSDHDFRAASGPGLESCGNGAAESGAADSGEGPARDEGRDEPGSRDQRGSVAEDRIDSAVDGGLDDEPAPQSGVVDPVQIARSAV